MSKAMQEEKRKLRETISSQRTRTTISYHRVREKATAVKSYFSIGRQIAVMTNGLRSIKRLTDGNKRSPWTWLRIALLVPTAASLFTYVVRLKKKARDAKLGKPDLPAG